MAESERSGAAALKCQAAAWHGAYACNRLHQLSSLLLCVCVAFHLSPRRLGHDTKIFMNATQPPSKRSSIERSVDYIIFFMFALLFSMCITGCIYFAWWTSTYMPLHWYLGPDQVKDAVEYNSSRPAIVGVTNFITSFILYGEGAVWVFGWEEGWREAVGAAAWGRRERAGHMWSGSLHVHVCWSKLTLPAPNNTLDCADTWWLPLLACSVLLCCCRLLDPDCLVRVHRDGQDCAVAGVHRAGPLHVPRRD